MSRNDFPSTHKYRIELEIRVTSAIALSSGEMCDLVSLGLFDLDHEGRFLPGITVPNNVFRLVSTRATPAGYERKVSLREFEAGALRHTFQSGVNGRTEDDTKLIEDLEVARGNLTDCFCEQRMLQARLMALIEKLEAIPDIPHEERAYAATLLAAVKGVLETHESVTRLVL